jgi:uncharacterized protein (DUF1697 family)
MRYVALLRGINLGRRNKVNMMELRTLFGKLGFSNVHTYIQTGNVFFRADEVDEDGVEKTLMEQFGFEIPVMIRTEEEIEQLTLHPFLEKENVTVFFLKREITLEQQKAMEELVKDPFVFANNKNLLVQHTRSYHQTTYTNHYFERKLHMYSTARNKNTTLKLKEKIQET